jgi:hypothetical protein
MRALRWKGWEQGMHGDWRARASRAVGGEYRISKSGGLKDWTGYYSEVSYRVEHRKTAHGNTRDLYARSPIGRRTSAHTLPEAMARRPTTIASSQSSPRQEQRSWSQHHERGPQRQFIGCDLIIPKVSSHV